MIKKHRFVRIVRFLTIAFVIMCFGALLGQQKNTNSRFHDLGTLMWRVDPFLFLDTSGPVQKPIASWPQGVYDSENCQFWWFVVMPESYTDSTGTVRIKERADGGLSPSVSPELANRGWPWGIYEYRRYAPPSVLVNGIDDTYDFTGEIDTEIHSDIKTVVRMKSSPGFWLTFTTYSFANQYHDDYVIHRIDAKYTGNWDSFDDDNLDLPEQDLKNVWFAVGYCMIPSFAGQKEILGWRWGGDAHDDWMDWEMRSPLYPSGLDGERDELLLIWGRDGDEQKDVSELEPGGRYFDHTGDPSFIHEVKGQFLSYQYPGYTMLHADKSVNDHSDDPEQPRTLAIAGIFEVWPGTYGSLGDYDFFTSGEKQHPPAEESDPDWKKGDHMFMGVGPYDFSIGDSISFVWSVGVGGAPYDSTVTKGAEWLKWYRGEPGATFDDEAKKEFLSQGLDSLYEYLSRSRWAWDKISRGEQIPAPLPSPNLSVTNGGGFIHLEWEDMREVPDPVTGVPDLDHYNIYRKRGAYLVNFKEDEFGKGINYRLLAEVPKDITEYRDTTAVRGESYHYYVTAVDDGTQNDGLFAGTQLESSHFSNRTKSPAVAFKAAPLHVDSVRVVPNPYTISGGDLNFTGENNKLLFVGLPAFCTVSIYNTTGDLIKRFRHTTGSSDESWDQLSTSNQRIASGVYVLHLTDCKRLDDTKLPDVVEKFVIIR